VGSPLDAEPPLLRIREPGELLAAVPYLLGFHPCDSLVLIGLRDARVMVTARLDLSALAADAGLVGHTVGALRLGGARALAAVVYDDSADVAEGRPLPWRRLIDDFEACAAAARVEPLDAMLIRRGRWWPYCCAPPGCGSVEGSAVPGESSTVAAAATYAGLVALSGRDEVTALLAPRDDLARVALEPLIAAHLSGVDRDGARSYSWATRREIFAAARRADRLPFTADSLSDDDACRYGVALGERAVRDALWFAIDERRLDGRPLWRELSIRLPGPFSAGPLLLFGWAQWREGNGALARIAAERALADAPGYRAAELLAEVIGSGVNPHRLPQLRQASA